jgi:energy-coupling factor transporter ATP-binding protein EcfA2
MSELVINDLHASIDTDAGDKEILRGVTLSVESGRTHAVMGPNGSGKSTLAYVIAGHPKYRVTSGSITLDGEDVLAMSVDERARAGLFLAMQYPVEVPGVSVSIFMRTSVTAVTPRCSSSSVAMHSAMPTLFTFVPARLSFLSERHADRCATLVTAVSPDRDRRLETLWLRGLSRPIRADEAAEAAAFLDRVGGLVAGKPPAEAEAEAWKELCLAVLSSSEFLYLF